ncbi:Mitochondrial carrier protein ymc2 [Entomophthora muscae]|uniref:Mitochondrial carrier protein ymc2 n=2 Tax=Entomophthora muscae TaxID=34485 RepID=A0ACC2U7Q3_9FUNG|nr:Mitochondrial carrier protein ymc2 [Entomophthora muscae]
MDSNGSAVRATKDCIAGSVGGVFQVLAGQPFDTVKVRLQTQSVPLKGELPKYNGPLDCVLKTFRNEGPAAFYKGTTVPIMGIGLCVSIQFLAFEGFKRHFTSKNRKESGDAFGFLTIPQLFVAGAGSGLANSVVSGPIEQIRSRLQIQSSSNAEFKGPIDCFRKLYLHQGLKGVYQGQVPTLAREVIGFGAYFAAYEYMVQKEIKETGLKRDQLSSIKVCQFGALAGYSMWIVAYPIDVIKSKMQTDGYTPATRKYATSMDCIKATYASSGIKGFFRGFLPCILRAAPANASTFLGVEMAMRFLNKSGIPDPFIETQAL